MPDEGRFSVGIFGWIPTGNPIIDKGKASIGLVTPARLDFQGKPKTAPGVELTFGVGRFNVLRVSYFQTRAAGNVTAPNDLNLWGGAYQKGDLLSTNYRLRNGKVSFDFLTWPFPVGTRKFRLKTLWQFQYVNMTTGFDAPLKSTDNGPNTTSGKKSIYLPSFGLGVAEYVSPKFRLEANASGFTLPHRSTIWDADASISYRFGKLEARVGGKAFHFRSTPNGDYYLRGTLAGAFVGIRYFLN